MNKAALICIGNELLSGRTLNSNLSYLGQELAKLGLPLHYSVVVRDDERSIRDALNYSIYNHDIIIITGGLGPTSDDLTKRSVAGFFNKDLIFDEAIWSAISQRFALRGMEVPEINRCQAEVPRDFTPLKNILGTAPGLFYEENKKLIFLLPGVPLEMKGLFNNEIKGLLKERFPSPPIIVRTIRTIGIAESKLAEITGDIEIPEGMELAFLPQLGRVDLRLSGIDQGLIDVIFGKLEKRSVQYIWGYDDESMAEIVGYLFKKKGLTLSIAESCTGGIIQGLITDSPGSSEYFRGGVVTYSNEAKIDLLGVREDTLIEQGAVSPEVAGEMSEGVRRVFKTDIGGAVTGIAGPSGGVEDKPVGTVWFSLSFKEELITMRRIFPGDREAIRRNAALYLLNMIRKVVKEW